MLTVALLILARSADVIATTPRPVQDVQMCIAKRWGRSMDATVIGPDVDLRYVGPFSRSNALTFTVIDAGTHRQITMSYEHPFSKRMAQTHFKHAARCWEQR